jgi:hypothetical protein
LFDCIHERDGEYVVSSRLGILQAKFLKQLALEVVYESLIPRLLHNLGKVKVQDVVLVEMRNI